MATETELLEKLKCTIRADENAAWNEFGNALAADEALLDQFRAKPSVVFDGKLNYRAGRILSFDDVVPEADRIRIPKRFPDPGMYYLLGSIGFGRRETFHHTAFFHARSVEVQIRNYHPDDCGWQYYLPNGDIAIYNSFWLPFCKCGNCSNIAYLNMEKGFGVFTHSPTQLQVKSPCITVFGRPNFSHFTIDQLPSILISQFLPETAKIPVLLKKFTPMQKEICQFFGVNLSRIQVLEDNIEPTNPTHLRFDDAYVPAFLPLPDRVHLLRNIIGSPSFKKGSRNLFIMRKPNALNPPRLINQDAIAEVLATRGFEPIFAEDYSIQGKKDLFSQANLVLSALGSGSTNMLFAPKRAVHIELRTTTVDNNSFDNWDAARRTCAIAGQDYIRIVCKPFPEKQNASEQNLSFQCAPDRVLRIVDAALEAMTP